MSRFPQPSPDSLFAGRPNGFRFRRMWLNPGTYAFTVPAWLPVGADGRALMKALLIGGGQGGGSSDGVNHGRGGNGAGLVLSHLLASPGETIDLVVGAGGTALGTGGQGNNGAVSTLTQGATVLSAHGGGTGTSSGGEINVNGAVAPPAANTQVALVPGAAAGSPFGIGAWPGPLTTDGEWLIPTGWDLTEPADFALDASGRFEHMRPFVGIGNAGLNTGRAPGHGGGGAKVSANSAHPGGSGLIIIWY